MATEISIMVFGDEFFTRRLRAVRYRARNLSPVMDEIADQWADIIDQQFETEGARGGTPWKQLERDTYLKRGSKHPILIDKGDLFDSAGRDNISVSDDEITIDWSEGQEEKGEAHQYGYFNVRAGRFVEARPPIVFTPADEESFRQQITEYLVNGDL